MLWPSIFSIVLILNYAVSCGGQDTSALITGKSNLHLTVIPCKRYSFVVWAVPWLARSLTRFFAWVNSRPASLRERSKPETSMFKKYQLSRRIYGADHHASRLVGYAVTKASELIKSLSISEDRRWRGFIHTTDELLYGDRCCSVAPAVCQLTKRAKPSL